MGNIIRPAELRERGSAIFYEGRKVGQITPWKKSIKLLDPALKNAVRERYPGYSITERLVE